MASTSRSFPYEIQDLDRETTEKVSKSFSDGLPHLVLVGPQRMLLPAQYREEAAKYYNFKLRPSDVVIMGYPRSGTTVQQEMAWLLLNNLDFDKAHAKKSLIARVPFLESRSVTTSKAVVEIKKKGDEPKMNLYRSSVETLEQMTERRVFKSHLHLNFLPPNLLTCGCKVIYVARNPKDLIVSFYHLQRNSIGRQFTESFETFLEYFMSDLTFFAPYWTHVQLAWERRGCDNFRFVFYEDLIENTRRHIEEVAQLLEVELSKEQADLLEDTLKFANFKKYMSCGNDKVMNGKQDVNDDFIRKGVVGGWKSYFNEEMNAKMDKWIKENLARTGIEFPFEF